MKTTVNKYYLLLLLFCGLFIRSEARHIAGGEMSYTYLGPGSNANSGLYRITLRLYRDCQSTGAELDEIAKITIYQNGVNGIFKDLGVPLTKITEVKLTTPGPCIDNAPIVC